VIYNIQIWQELSYNLQRQFTLLNIDIKQQNFILRLVLLSLTTLNYHVVSKE